MNKKSIILNVIIFFLVSTSISFSTELHEKLILNVNNSLVNKNITQNADNLGKNIHNKNNSTPNIADIFKLHIYNLTKNNTDQYLERNIESTFLIPKKQENITGFVTPNSQISYYKLKYYELVQNGNSEKSISTLKKLIEIAPSNDYYYNLAQTYWLANDTENSLTVLQKATELYPNDTRFYEPIISILLSSNRSSQIQEILVKYQKFDKKNLIPIYENVGATYLQQKQYQLALEYLEKIPTNARSDRAMFLFSQTYDALGLYQKSEQILKTLSYSKTKPIALQALLQMAFLHEQRKDYKNAAYLYNKYLRISNDDSEIRLRYIQNLVFSNQIDRAKREIKKIPNDTLKIRAISFFVATNKFKVAEELIKQFDNSTSSNDELSLDRALIALDRDKNVTGFITNLQKIPAKSILYQEGQSHLQFVLNQLIKQNNPTAESNVKLAKKIFPDNKYIYLSEADILLSQNKTKEMLNVLKLATQKWQNDSSIMFAYGSTLAEYENRELGLKYIEASLKINPENVQALNYIGYTLTIANKDLERARVLLEKAVTLAPDNSYVIDSLAWLYFRTEKYASAWIIIQKAASLNPNNPIILEHYGDIAVAIGEKQKARTAYKKLLILSPTKSSIIQQKLNSIK